MRYRLIAIDLDGTLLSPDHTVSAANRDAIARATDAGAQVVPCTGRAWHEALPALTGIPGLDLGIFTTGATINHIATGQALHATTFAPKIAAKILAALAHLPEPILILRNRHTAGHDYLIAGHGQLTDNARWWFDHHNAQILHDPDPTDLAGCLRFAVLSSDPQIPELRQNLEQTLGHDLEATCFAGLPSPNGPPTQALEIFPAGVDKWSGIQWLARHHDIPLPQIAAIGDQVNDIPMLLGAGCGIAMGNAVTDAQNAADRHTLHHETHGVAHAIDQLLNNTW